MAGDVELARKALAHWADLKAGMSEIEQVRRWFVEVVRYVDGLPDSDPALKQVAAAMPYDRSDQLPVGDQVRDASRYRSGDDAAAWTSRVAAAAERESVARGEMPSSN